MSLSISLPWPAPILWPNRHRGHWAPIQEARNGAKRAGFYLAKEAGAQPIAGDRRITVSILFQAPTKRRYDLDGALGAIKAQLDGIAMALNVDDSLFDLVLSRGAPIKDGAVVVEIS